MSCLDPASPITPTIIIGEDKTLSVQLVDDTGQPIDLSTATEIDAMFMNADGTCVHKKLSTAGVVLTSGPFGKFNVLLSGADTAALQLSPAAPNPGLSGFEIHYRVNGLTTFVLLRNSLSIIPRMFPAC